MKRNQQLVDAFKREFGDLDVWWSRSVVILAAAAAGLTVVGFTWLTEHAIEYFAALRTAWWWATLLWMPASAAGIVWLTRRYVPGATGSGIPQVMASLEHSVKPAQVGLFVSMRLSLAKIALSTWGLLAGFSLGREGPSVQIAAGVMLSARRWLPKRSGVTDHGLLVTGGAAGIAAAFNTPLAGVMFAIEELSRSPEQRSSGLLVTGIVLAGLVAVSFNGNGTYFGVIRSAQVSSTLILPGLLVAVLSGLAGGLFARLMITSLTGRARDRISLWRLRRPVAFAAACGLALAVIGLVSRGATFGSGYAYTRGMLAGTETVPAVYLLLKFIATWVTAWSTVPGGIFAPALAIGAALGNDIAMLTGYPHAQTLIALGMAGFLAAATRAPLTSFIIVMEMVDGHAMVLSLMISALIASGVSKVLSRPLYTVLAEAQLKRLPESPSPVSTPRGSDH
jgi:H+/Cl- antiporter ClcA